MRGWYLVLTALALGLASAHFLQKLSDACDNPQVLSYKVVSRMEREAQYFTQGLFFHEGFLYEGTGRNGQSGLYQIDYASGLYRGLDRLPPRYFGEGISFHKGKIFQLTWQSGQAFVFEQQNTDWIRQEAFRYSGEGWGLTSNGDHLIMSDGSPEIRFLDEAGNELSRIEVKRGEKQISVRLLNELEWVQGRIWANVWHSDEVIRIHPQSGCVDAVLDLSSLRSDFGLRTEYESDLNGIAWNPQSDHFYVTGKLWSRIFEIQILNP